MIEIHYTDNFEQIDKTADELLTEYDTENGVKYNFRRFAFVANDGDLKVGYLTGYSYYSEVTINNIIVIEKYRNKGIGSSLIKRVVDYYKNKNFNNVNLVTNEFQAPNFYKKCGFDLEFVRKNNKNPKLTKYFFIKYFK